MKVYEVWLSRGKDTGGQHQLRVLVSSIRVIAEIFRVWHFLI